MIAHPAKKTVVLYYNEKMKMKNKSVQSSPKFMSCLEVFAIRTRNVKSFIAESDGVTTVVVLLC